MAPKKEPETAQPGKFDGFQLVDADQIPQAKPTRVPNADTLHVRTMLEQTVTADKAGALPCSGQEVSGLRSTVQRASRIPGMPAIELGTKYDKGKGVLFFGPKHLFRKAVTK